MSKTALVIGSSRGIGKELVNLFSNSNITCHAFARSEQGSNHDAVSHHFLDLNSHNVKAEFTKITDAIATFDYVIYNAGSIIVKPFTELTRNEIQDVYNVNVVAAMELLQVCIPKMAKDGHIVLISSMGGFQGTMKFAGLSAYSTSKAALASLTELLAEEYKEAGFSINCLCLGSVQTEMLEEAFPGYKAAHSAKEMASFIYDFTLNSGKYFKGKILPVSISTP
jgi:NAD(P)-dependent dehydrogenase (short-subunit alcohol dehydrogenase family)